MLHTSLSIKGSPYGNDSQQSNTQSYTLTSKRRIQQHKFSYLTRGGNMLYNRKMAKESWDSTNKSGSLNKFIEVIAAGYTLGPVDQRVISSAIESILKTGDVTRAKSLLESRLKMKETVLDEKTAEKIINDSKEYYETYKDEIKEALAPVKKEIVNKDISTTKVEPQATTKTSSGVELEKSDAIIDTPVVKEKLTIIAKSLGELNSDLILSIPNTESNKTKKPSTEKKKLSKKEDGVETETEGNNKKPESETKKGVIIKQEKTPETNQVLKIEDLELENKIKDLVSRWEEKLGKVEGDNKKDRENRMTLGQFKRDPLDWMRMAYFNALQKAEGMKARTTDKKELVGIENKIRGNKTNLNIIDHAIENKRLNETLATMHQDSIVTITRDNKNESYRITKVEDGQIFSTSIKDGKIAGKMTLNDVRKLILDPQVEIKVLDITKNPEVKQQVLEKNEAKVGESNNLDLATLEMLDNTLEQLKENEKKLDESKKNLKELEAQKRELQDFIDNYKEESVSVDKPDLLEKKEGSGYDNFSPEEKENFIKEHSSIIRSSFDSKEAFIEYYEKERSKLQEVINDGADKIEVLKKHGYVPGYFERENTETIEQTYRNVLLEYNLTVK